MRRLRSAMLLLLIPAVHAFADTSAETSVQKFPGRSPARILTEKNGLPHVVARTETDMAFLQGYAHARDRLFQLDSQRRVASGTLAELVGPGAIASDVQFRTLGLRRAGERSLAVASPEARAVLAAYAAGVNAYASANPLPPEYGPLEISRFSPWTEVDSLTFLKFAEFTSIALDDIDRTLRLTTYQAVGARAGFDGTALMFGDLERAEPFDSASPVLDAMEKAPRRGKPLRFQKRDGMDASHLDATTLRLARELLERVRAAPQFDAVVNAQPGDKGSNAWVVSGRFSLSGEPMIASDPHVTLTQPSTFYNMHLKATEAGIDVIGATFVGIPYVAIGNTKHVSWGATAAQIDVTDIYAERVVPDPKSPSGLSTLYKGTLEPVVALPQTFLVNRPGDGIKDNLVKAQELGLPVPPAVLIVPRRNDGPILQFDQASGNALSFQWTGNSGTRGVDAFRGFALAKNVHDFGRAIDFIDAGGQNFVVSDSSGNIAYYLSGEVPLREDLQAGEIAGVPPIFIRNGQGGNEWIRATDNDPTRAIPFQILPKAEMPKIVNPPRGFIATANNDPSGGTLDNDSFNERRPTGGILYFGGTLYAPGIRAGRIGELLEERIKRKGRISMEDMQDIQADTVMNDARFFTPFILRAFDNARKSPNAALAQLAAEPRIAEAVKRLAGWDQSTPTGIREGYDAEDAPGSLRAPTLEEIQHSVAATIYSIWRIKFLRNTLLATAQRFDPDLPLSPLRRHNLGAAKSLLESFDEQQGIGASGINFFDVPGVADAAARRDIVLLRSVGDALDLLSGETYAPVFNRSTSQDDYRWGRLHRLIQEHPLGGPFNLPSAGGAFPSPLGEGLPGVPIDGGLFTVDVASSGSLLDESPSIFLVKLGPGVRYVSRGRAFGGGYESESSIPGGYSGVLGSPLLVNLFEEYLTNKTHSLRMNEGEFLRDVGTVDLFLPAPKR
jgi:penicillin G amidase